VLGGAPAMRAENAQPVGVVDHETRIVTALQLDDLRQRTNVPLHREHAVDHDQSTAFNRHARELVVEIRHVVVTELDDPPEAQPGAVDDARVIEAVEKHRVVPTEQAREHAQVDLKPGSEGKRRLAAHECRETLLQFNVDAERPVEQPGSRGARPVLAYRVDRRFLDLGMARQPEVIVRPEHDHRPAVDGNNRVLRRLDGSEVGVDPAFPDGVGESVLATFVEYVQAIPPSGAPLRIADRGAFVRTPSADLA